jgi:hypothetical protein
VNTPRVLPRSPWATMSPEEHAEALKDARLHEHSRMMEVAPIGSREWHEAITGFDRRLREMGYEHE